MQVRIFSLPFDPTLRGFNDAALRNFVKDVDVITVGERPPQFASTKPVGKYWPKNGWAADGLRDDDVVLSTNGEPTKNSERR